MPIERLLVSALARELAAVEDDLRAARAYLRFAEEWSLSESWVSDLRRVVDHVRGWQAAAERDLIYYRHQHEATRAAKAGLS